MKKTFLKGLVLASLVIVSSATVAMAASTTVDMSGTLVDSLAVTIVKPLLLGTLELKTNAADADAYIIKGAATDPAGAQLAEVKVDAAIGALLTITIDPTAELTAPDVTDPILATFVTNLLPGATVSLPLTVGTTYGDTSAVAAIKGRMATTSLSFKVGAILGIEANATPAAYVGTFAVAVVYQ